ncbi:glycosyltransferase family 2 protein [Marivirga sericea]|uniref:glycosyltransferase family 2 protein n=1 Tax=Marivirga sericea TaxID=1028 RepID=UPI000A1CBA7D|nr:glycosyltransferase family 2 protein [Marivirga sericea]
MKIKLSAVVITFNEEKNIRRCLSSLTKVADEIIVVDSFSSDRTEEICSEFHCEFKKNPFEGHIQQKNFAVQQASNEYVLSLDADEELSEELIDSILSVKTNWEYDAYFFNRLSSYCGKFFRHGSWYPDQKVRLFDRRLAEWGGTNPHDKIILSSSSKKHLKGDLLHYTYHTIEEHLKQVNYFSTVAAKAAYDQGKRFTLFKLIFKPFWRFFRDYFLKHGFLGGYRGLTICLLTAVETYLKIIKLWEIERAKKTNSQH